MCLHVGSSGASLSGLGRREKSTGDADNIYCLLEDNLSS